MDLEETIQQLQAEKERLEHVIRQLEQLQRDSRTFPGASSGGKRRGRKGMNAKERQEVSDRMKEYWANRRRATTISRQ